MNRYESVILIDPSSKDIIRKTKDKYIDALSMGKRTIHKMDDVGEKMLAYDIKEHKTAYYVLFYWYGTPDDVLEIEREFRIDDNVLKFMTIRFDEDSEDWPEEDTVVPVASESEQNDQIDHQEEKEIDMFDLIFNKGGD